MEKVIEKAEGVTAPTKTFTFKLSGKEVVEEGEDAVPMPKDTTASITGIGKVSDGNDPFGAITYTKAGKYTYTITETGTAGAFWTYNTNGDITATVTVSEDQATGALNATVTYDGKTNGKITNKFDAHVSVKKTDVVSGKELEGATIQILDSKKTVVAEWTSTKEAHEVNGLKINETYTLHETVAPTGYTIAADTTFTIDEEGKVTSTGTVTQDGVLLVEDSLTEVKVSKVDVADGKELEGAHIQIIEKDADGNEKVVAEWDSTKEVHEVTGLKTGVEYILRETVAPDGYTVTTDTTFTIDKNGKVTSTGTVSEEGVMLVEDAMTSVKVSKVDIADGKELEGAKIQILDKDGKVVEKWTSTKEVHEVKGLKTGEKYTLRETVAPDGYTVTTDTTFTIDKNGKVTSTGTVSEEGVMLVEDAMTVVKVSKVDVADGKELEGAHIQIIVKEGLFKREKVVAEWDSTKEVHEVTGLKTGVEYILRETVAPDGYTVTTDTTFTIDKNGKVTSTGTVSKEGVMLVEDAMTVVKVSKVDIADGKELEGAKIQILDDKGKVVEEWTSGKEAHEVTGLKTGVKYTLRETVAPDGYTVTTDTTFTIDKNGKVTSTGTITEGGVMLIEDAMTEIKVSKVDVADGKELEGAKIQILDDKGKVVAEWTSGKQPHVVKGLKTGVKYTLHEVVAPNGYEITADTTFTIDKYGNVTSSGTITKDGVLLIEDAKKEEHHKKPKKKDSTNTGDEAPLGVLFGGLGIGAVGLAVLLEERRRRSKKS